MPENCNACERSETASEALSERGARLTDLRRDVLQTLHHSPKPVGAYELFDQLKEAGKASAPPAVYRVLDFLVEQGLAHKLQSLSAYTACKSTPHAHEAFFRICRECGQVTETAVPASLKDVAAQDEFIAEHLVVEALGLCRECQESTL